MASVAHDRAGPVFGALSDPTRRQVFALVSRHGGEATATSLASELSVTRQAVHKHLASLADAGLVSARRDGRNVRYSPTPEPLSDAVSWITSVGSEWDARLAALRLHLRR